jgi:3-hydroxyisobutyrate dehydrogenase
LLRRKFQNVCSDPYLVDNDDQREVIGFIGIGLLGRPIAVRLLDAEYDLVVWNRTPEKCDGLAELGAVVAESIGELMEQVDIVLLCLADTAAVESVVFGDEGIAAFGDEDQLLVDLSSIDAHATREFARDLDQRCGMAWVDAPVSGGVRGAEQGRLVVMAGGHEEDIERAREVFAAFAQRVTRMGPIGAGQVTKVCNQMMVGCMVLGLAEMIALAERTGVDAELIPAALAGGFADSLPLQIFAPRMAVRQYEPQVAKLGTLMKDLDHALHLARDSVSAVPITALALQLLRQHLGRVDADADWSTLIEMYSQ